MKTIFYNLTKSQQELVKAQQGKSLQINFKQGQLSASLLPPKDTEILCIHTAEKISAEIVTKLPTLKLIITRTAGVDHIDIPACEKQGIKVVNAPGLNAQSVAEHVIALMVSVARRLPDTIANSKKGNFKNKTNLSELSGKTLGVIGTGAIGSKVVKFAKALGMKVVAHDLFPNNKLAKELGFEYQTLLKVVGTADVLSLHMPASKQTHHLFNSQMFKRMKPGAVLINTARGSVVNAKDLLLALQKGYISFAGLDVLEEESNLLNKVHRSRLTDSQKRLLDINQKLIKHPRVYFTPHLAHESGESATRTVEYALKTAQEFAKKS